MQQRARQYTLQKDERLCSKKAIQEVFDNGKYITEKPISLLWLIKKNASGNIPVKVAFTAPKANFKHAVKRNLLKRRMREAYRKNKAEITNAVQSMQAECLLVFIYTGSKQTKYAEIESKIIVILHRLIKQAGG